MFEKITEAEINERSMANVSTTPNRPTAFGESKMDAQALKLRFDRLGRYLAGRLNEIFTALNEGNFAQAVYINHQGQKVNLETFITNLLTGDVDDIQIKTVDGIVYLTELGNKVQEIYNGQDTGDLAGNITIVDGVTLKKFYEDFLKMEDEGQGEPGKSAYDYAVEGGYQGTEEEFAKKLATEYPSKVSQLENDEKYITASGAPVQTVNGKAGNVSLSAADVGARPNTWTPTASDVGARPATWMPSYSDVGAEKAGNVAVHNTSNTAHNDLRILIQGLSDRINAVLDSDDTTLDELSEIVAYIKANKTLIESVTTSKVNVSDIIDNLETPDPKKPLSAAQGVYIMGILQQLVTEFGEALEGKANSDQGVFFIKGGGTTDTTNKVAIWTGSHEGITEYYDGLMIAYKIGTAGSTTTTLNINGLGAVPVVRNATTAISTAYPVNSVALLTYTVDGSTAYWKSADYDSNSYAYVRQYYTTTNNNYPLLFKYDAGITDTTNYVTKYTRSSNKIYANPSTGVVTATKFKGALEGNADTATKATQDGNGNNIPNTYETKKNATEKYAELEGKIANAGGDNVPDYIVAEAERVAKAVQATRTAKSLVFPIMSDMHLYDGNSAHENSLISAQYAGMGIKELQKRIHLDFTGYLGDYTTGAETYTAEQVMKDITAFKKTTDTTGNEIWCVGNHDINYGANRDRILTLDEMYSYIGANSDGVKPYANIERGYGYLDFDNQKIRVIYLNTCDASDWPVTAGVKATSEWISPTQIQWLADTALDFSDKETPSEWGIVLEGHHPLHYAIGCFGYVMTILEAYRDGLSGTISCTICKETDGTYPQQVVTYNFSNTERAEIICNIHGHNHNCGMSMISSSTWKNTTEVTPWLWRFCIPNLCANRYNEAATSTVSGFAERYGEFDSAGKPVYWTKEVGTAKATSFCVVNIDRKNKKAYAHIFGAGRDRIINYTEEYVPIVYNISVSARNCTASSSNPSTIVENGTATLTFTANSGYALPDSVTVTGATSTWDKASGKLLLSDPTGNVSVTVVAVVPAPSYNNLIPTSIDTDGSIYNGKGFSTGYLSSGVVTANSNRCVTGFMPIGYGSANAARGEQVIHFADINVPEGDGYTRVSFYDADKTHIATQNGVSFKATDDGQASSIYTASNGMIKTVDVTGYTAYLRNNMGKTTAFFRVSVPGATGITSSSIITVNEPIE